PGYGARILRLVEFFFLENEREGIGAHAVLAKHSDQAAGIDPARKKNPDRNIADHMRKGCVVQDLFEVAAARTISIRLACRTGMQWAPILTQAQRSIIESQDIPGWNRSHAVYDGPRFVNRSESEITEQASRIEPSRYKPSL